MLSLEKDLEEILDLNLSKEQYEKYYLELIDQCKETNRDPNMNYEIHHINMVSWGGDNDINNLVPLTSFEHIVAHCLLFLANPESRSAALALHFMINGATPFINTREKAISDFLNRAGHFRDIALSATMKSVVCLDDDLNIMKIYKSLTLASLDGFSLTKISSVINGKRKRTGGYYWKTYSEVVELFPEKLNSYLDNIKLNGEPKLSPKQIDNRVICCDLNDNPLKVYKNASNTKEDGFNPNQVIDTYSGKQGISYGYKWYRYKDYKNNHADKLINFNNNQSIKPNKIDYRVIACDSNFNIIKIYNSLENTKTIDYAYSLAKNGNKSVVNKDIPDFKGIYWYHYEIFSKNHQNKLDEFEKYGNQTNINLSNLYDRK